MSFPNFEDKINSSALFTPEAYWRYYQQKFLKSDKPAPRNLIVCYQPFLFHAVRQKMSLTPYFSHTHFIDGTDGKIGIFHSGGIGAPDIVANLEVMIAAGVRNVVTVGSAGSLQPELPVGSFMAAGDAIRDEGTSHHYLKPEKLASASAELTQMLSQTARARQQKLTTGTIWTTDAPYRETRNEVARYQAENVLGVDMEAAAVFSLAHYRKISAAALFCISDVLTVEKWEPHFHFKVLKTGLMKLFDIALETLKMLSD